MFLKADKAGILKSLEKTFHRFYDQNTNVPSLVSPSTSLWILQSSSSYFSATCLGRLLLLGIKRNPMSLQHNQDDPLSKCISTCLTSKSIESMDDELRNNTRYVCVFLKMCSQYIKYS